MVKVKTTKSAKRYTFESFRERVDSLKIEPSKKLNTRAFDEVESSHFLSSMERWVEFNRSAVFTSFVDNVESIVVSLPQILHYKSKIFQELVDHISKHDKLSLQPLLELLTQFCHDLGPDFLEFYEKSVMLIADAALDTDNNTSETLEWEFNSLAFIFKYLSRTLSKDLIPTFKLLEPLMLSKEYIARFSAEALSFLVRKTNQENLQLFTEYAFNKVNEDEQFTEPIVTVFSEALKSTQGSIHSKSPTILRSLLNQTTSDSSSSAFCDILLEIINFGSKESVGEIYTLIIKIMNEKLASDDKFLDHFCKILTMLIFADSGKKIPDWKLITDSITAISSKVKMDQIQDETKYLLIHLIAVFSRNCEVQDLTRYHTSLYRFALTLDSLFLPLILTIIQLSRERAVKFTTKFVQEFINKKWQGNEESIAFFIEDLNKRDLIAAKVEDTTRFRLTIPTALTDSIYQELNTIKLTESKDLYDIFWRLYLLENSTNYNEDLLKKVLQKIQAFDNGSKFKNTIQSKLISVLLSYKSADSLNLIVDNFENLYQENEFVKSSARYFRANKDYTHSTKFITLLSNNLSTADHDLRYESAQLISILSNDEEMTSIANQCSIIEQIPLTLENGRDIGIRVRGLADYIKRLETKDDLRSQIYFKFFFGLLTVKFSPSWEGVFSTLPDIAYKNTELVWQLAFSFISNSEVEKKQEYYDFELDESEEVVNEWESIDTRFDSIINNSIKSINSYINKKNSLMDDVENSYSERSVSAISRINAIKVLKSIPSIAEAHSSQLVSIVLNNVDDDEEVEDLNFSKVERNSIIGIFTTFKKLQSIERADELRLKFLRLLSSRNSDIKKTALECLLNFHNKHLNKYRDNFNNLLDDKFFRDEISKIFSKAEDSVIEADDLPYVAPLVLRILFGRAQSNHTSGNKKGLKFASINILASMEPRYIEEFLSIVTEKIYDSEDVILDFGEIRAENVTSEVLRRNLGFANLLWEIIKTLGEKFTAILTKVIKPLLLTLVNAQVVIDAKIEDSQINAVARNVRQSGTKNLHQLFTLLHEYSWDEHIETIYERILAPRFLNFEDENLQQTSSLLKILISWTQHKSYYELLLINNLEPSLNVISLLGNPNTKTEVLSDVFEFATNVITTVPSSKKYVTLHEAIAEKTFQSLPDILARTTDPKVNSEAIDLLLALVEKNHVQTQERRAEIVNLSTQLLEKPNAHLFKESRLQVLRILRVLIQEFEGDFEGIKHLYEVASRFLRLFTDKQQRLLLVELFTDIGEKFDEYAKACSLIEEMNSFSRKGMNEFDYDRRLAAFRLLNDELYSSFSYLEWLPLVNNSLFFINDADDLSIRTNASYSLRRFIDAFSQKDEANKELIHIFKDLLLPNLRIGLRSKVEVVQTEYIALLSHIVSDIRHVEGFEDMKCLLHGGDEEANFFTNINHIQLHRRQRAIKRLSEFAKQITGANIAHYLLPIMEHYAYCTDDRLRNIANEAVSTIEHLISCVSYRQFLAIFKRYQSGLKEGSSTLKDSVSLIVTVSKALLTNVKNEDSRMDGLPSDSDLLDVQIEKEMIEPVAKVLNKRNEETSVTRAPLIEALASLIMCLSHERIVFILPGVLTNICQVLRVRYDDLREATRKYLGRASNILGATYIKFIITELKTALTKGFQIHVLGYTVNAILNLTQFKHGELDDSASMIMEIVMENIFGSTGQEKEADGYRTTMKEVKNNKSSDTAELLGRVISLSHFSDFVRPVKLLLHERITLKIQNKLDELIRRFSLGVYKNAQLNTQEMLVLCYELFDDSEKDNSRPAKAEPTETQKHFLVQLDAKPLRVESGNTLYVETFQKLALELLRNTLTKNPDFITADKLAGFLPYFITAMESESEAVIVGVLKVLSLCISVSFDEDTVDIFRASASRCLDIIKNYPSTESELVQACFKYLTSVLRHREELTLNENSLGYLLIRVQPDLQEQSRQGLAFNFIKSLVSKHVLIPEVYDTMDKLREVMVTSHSKERRDVSRSIYFQFLMEYDQGRGRLEKQFKFLVENLSYPTEEGKQSVMELIHLILSKSNQQLLDALSTSFFVGLAKILISETSVKTREMAVSLITTIFEKSSTDDFEKYIVGWLNSKNSALLKCALQLYRIKLKVTGIKGSIDEVVITNIKEVLVNSRPDSEIEVSWEIIYTALNCLLVLADKGIDLIDEDLKLDIIASLLYPHSWIRLASSRLVGLLLSKKDVLNGSDIQNIANRLFHQLRAPRIEESLGTQNIKSLTSIFMNWEKNGTLFDYSLLQKDDEVKDALETDEQEEEVKELMASDWAIKQASGSVRIERISSASKKACIQFLAMTVQILSKERVLGLSEELILPLYQLTENNNTEEELANLSLECLKMIETKIGVTDYTQAYSNVRIFVMKRRQDRRTHRARLAVSAPEVIAKRKNKKHERTREKRKHEKDANGYYHTKKKQRS